MNFHRPGWDSYFLGLAFAVSRRSHDRHTKHGCVIVDRQNHIVATGYNGFPPGMDDSSLPLNRPDKYAWMVHAEANAIANSTTPLAGAGATAYVTGKPCFECAKSLYRNGVRDWVLAERRGMSSESPDELANFDRLVREGGVSIRRIRPDLSWMFDPSLVQDLLDHGFLTRHLWARAVASVRGTGGTTPAPTAGPAAGGVEAGRGALDGVARQREGEGRVRRLLAFLFGRPVGER